MNERTSISRTKLKIRIHRKTDPRLAAVIFLASKNKAWFKFAKLFSQATRQHAVANLSAIDKQTSMGDTILIPGRVLSVGEITKKIRVASFGISKEARERLNKTRSEWIHILDEMKKNPKAEGIKLIK
jgi:large subunit ribosomal protein L18e